MRPAHSPRSTRSAFHCQNVRSQTNRSFFVRTCLLRHVCKADYPSYFTCSNAHTAPALVSEKSAAFAPFAPFNEIVPRTNMHLLIDPCQLSETSLFSFPLKIPDKHWSLSADILKSLRHCEVLSWGSTSGEMRYMPVRVMRLRFLLRSFFTRACKLFLALRNLNATYCTRSRCRLSVGDPGVHCHCSRQLVRTAKLFGSCVCLTIYLKYLRRLSVV